MLDEYQDLIEELLGTPGLVRGAEPLDPRRLGLVALLQERDAEVLGRLQRLVRESSPHLTALPEFAEMVSQAGAAADSAGLLELFDTTRGDLVSLLMNLTLRDWERTATSDAGGETSLVEEVEQHVVFDEAFRATFSE